MDRVIRRKELLSIIGISRSTLYDWMASGTFPRPIRLGRRAVGWRSKDISDWLEKLPSRLSGLRQPLTRKENKHAYHGRPN
ncbi:helix-turn-helix transcriptional regulator [Sphingomonas pruni]|uniref:helix-turn-helix transcriptional regulator n=1 Tax=Sphingomonas pruni TaxID=40683 RepID=UPI000A004503|nr:AlpA family phage regulatory protein [Sphingomonas pruni]